MRLTDGRLGSSPKKISSTSSAEVHVGTKINELLNRIKNLNREILKNHLVFPMFIQKRIYLFIKFTRKGRKRHFDISVLDKPWIKCLIDAPQLLRK